MAKKVKVNYRRICKEHNGYTDEEMKGMDVHHMDGDRQNNDPSNLKLLTPEEHARIHKHDFVLWAREGARLGNQAFRERLKEHGPTEAELAYKEIRIQNCKKGLHNTPHKESTKKLISEKKKKFYAEDKTRHPLWGKTEYEVTSPDGEIFTVSGGWKEWCEERGLGSSNLRKVAQGLRKQHKGWTAKIKNG